MRKSTSAFLILSFSLLLSIPGGAEAQAQKGLTLGYSGVGINSTLRRVIEKERLWLKHGLDVKSVYFNSGTVTGQALLGGDVQFSDGDLTPTLNMAATGVLDLKVIAVTFNRLQHIFVVRKDLQKPEDLKNKKIAVSSFGSVSDSMTRVVLRFWKVDPEKEVVILPTGNTPTRIAALVTGRVDAGLVVAESLPKVLGSGYCRVLADLLDVPIDYALYGIVVTASLLRSQRNSARQFLEGVIEGISIFKTRQEIVLEVLREEGVKDPELAKQVYARLAKSLRPIPTAEPPAIQAILDSSLNPKVRNAKAEDFIDGKLLDEVKASGYVDRLYKR